MRNMLYIIAVILSFALLSCAAVAIAKSQLQYLQEIDKNTTKGQEQYEVLFRQFIQTVEESLELRQDAKLLFKELNRKLSSGEHLKSSDQQALRRNLAQYLENRDSLESTIGKFNVYSNRNVTIIFPSNSPSRMVENANYTGTINGIELYINPNDDFGRLVIRGIKMWLTSKLIVFDNYVVVIVRYLKKTDIRRQFGLEDVDPEGKRFLEEISEEMTDGEKYERTVKIIELVQRILEYEKNHPSSELARDKDNSYLDTLIEGSYAYHRIPELSYIDELEIEIAVMGNAFYDYIDSLSDQATNSLSDLFGNAIGLYEERKGKLFDMLKTDQEKITGRMQLLDILFEKTPFRLTDLFIPGHWGHVAIWVGGKDDIPELKRLGVWQELPGIEEEARSNLGYSGPSFQKLIEQNHSILEALRHGVEINTFGNFLNIDDLSVIRNNSLTDRQKKEFLLRAFAQIGKEYDFNFDIETNQTIVCSELIFVVYDDYDWPVAKNLGRYTVSPDHVAALALKEEDPFAPILIYHDGKELPKHHNRKNFKLLLEGTYDDILFTDN